MGCDIHDYAEVRDAAGTWRVALPPEPNPYYDPKDADERPMQLPTFDVTGGRNYSAFAILGDVRNGYGFGGLDTGDGFTPIGAHRGLPPDASAEVRAESESWDGDGHSHSYVLLSELLACDWAQKATQRGILSALTYDGWRGYGRRYERAPNEYSAGISGPGIRIVDAGEADAILDSFREREGVLWQRWRNGGGGPPSVDRLYVRAEWPVWYSEAAGELYTRGIPRLAQLARVTGAGPDGVRVVFWFDN